MLQFSSLIAKVYDDAKKLTPEDFTQALFLEIANEFNVNRVVVGLEDRIVSSHANQSSKEWTEHPLSYDKLVAWIKDETDTTEVINYCDGKPLLFRAHGPSDHIAAQRMQFLYNKKAYTGLLHGDSENASGCSRWILLISEQHERLEEDASFILEALWPHLTMAITLNFNMTLHRMDASRANRTLALVSGMGNIETADPRFLSLLSLEWKHKHLTTIPAHVLSALRSEGVYSGKNITLTAKMEGTHLVCRAEPRSALNCLGPVEKDIAMHLASGLSYKEIAVRLGKSPNTVRNQIAHIYHKLEVDCKVALIGLFNQRLAV